MESIKLEEEVSRLFKDVLIEEVIVHCKNKKERVIFGGRVKSYCPLDQTLIIQKVYFDYLVELSSTEKNLSDYLETAISKAQDNNKLREYIQNEEFEDCRRFYTKVSCEEIECIYVIKNCKLVLKVFR